MKNKHRKSNEMKISLLGVILNFGSKVIYLLSTVYGWISTIIISLLAFLFPLKDIFIILLIVVLVDLLLGLIIHRKDLQSSKLRESLFKFLIYIILVSLTFSIEVQLSMAILYKIVFAIASLTELYSIAAQALVIFPNFPFLRIFKNILAVEISKKTNINLSKVDEILEDKEKLEDKVEKGEN